MPDCQHEIAVAPGSGVRYCRKCKVYGAALAAAPAPAKLRLADLNEAQLEALVYNRTEQFYRWYAFNQIWSAGASSL